MSKNRILLFIYVIYVKKMVYNSNNNKTVFNELNINI